MLAQDSAPNGEDTRTIDKKMRRFRFPATIWGCLVWLLIALLFLLLISYVVVPWWYGPVPTDLPPATML